MNKLFEIISKLDGYKTYLVAIVTAVLNLLVALGWVSVDNLNQINVVLAALGGMAIRDGIAKK